MVGAAEVWASAGSGVGWVYSGQAQTPSMGQGHFRHHAAACSGVVVLVRKPHVHMAARRAASKAAACPLTEDRGGRAAPHHLLPTRPIPLHTASVLSTLHFY